MVTFNTKFLVFALTLFIIELLIAFYVRDNFVRPYLGDFLVVFLIYCAVRAFIKASPLKIAIGVLLFTYLIETFQSFRLVDRLGLASNAIAKTIIGYGFEWWDMLAYTLGIITILILESFTKKGLHRS
jgi:hypothetical protein